MFIREVTGNLTKGQILRYMFMPQVVPRLHQLLSAGFSNLAYMIALVYRAVNLIPATHPMFQREHRDTLSVRQVIGTAAAQLKFTRGHIDQVVIFFVILIGMVLLALQFVLTLSYVMANPALAAEAPTTYAGFFASPDLKEDIAYQLLYTVFGVPELFKPGATVSSFHTALYSLFQLYSIGLLVVAVFIVCYFIFAIAVETAQTGAPFGKRYNHVWTPIRLVFALGLLMPVGYGLNSAQWITLYAAKFGSDFATKGWITFNDTMSEAYLSKPEERVGTPKPPNVVPLASFMTVALACKKAYEDNYDGYIIAPYVMDEPGAESLGQPKTLSSIAGDYGKANSSGSPDDRDVTKAQTHDIFIRFGRYSKTDYPSDRLNVSPLCGDLAIPGANSSEEGSASMQKFYKALINNIWAGQYGLKTAAELMVTKYIKEGGSPSAPDADPTFKAVAIEGIRTDLEKAIKTAVDLQAGSKSWDKNVEDVKAKGWGGAGIWYNKIAQINGSLVTSVGNVPAIKTMPALVEYMKGEQLQQNRNTTDLFTESLSDGKQMNFPNSIDANIGPVLSIVYNTWAKDPAVGNMSNQTSLTGNIFIDVVNWIFGTQGLYAMCQNSDVHPLAQLSQLGKGMVEAAIRNIFASLLFTAGTLLMPAIGVAAGPIAAIAMSVASMTIVMGFMLYYVLPFMPFLYFFFAVGGWIKGLFEAMVGVPLWALAFLRIDGEGLPGDAAMDGFYLIFEIFLRPLLIVFGLLASVVIFAAMVKVLNEIFSLVVQNLSGHDPNSAAVCGGAVKSGSNTGNVEQDAMSYFRGPIDELFFTIMYAIIVYIIGMSCFKLIDLVPNNILRYMGKSVNTFNDKASDPAEGLGMRLSIGGNLVSNNILGQGGVLSSLGDTAKGLGAAVTEGQKP